MPNESAGERRSGDPGEAPQQTSAGTSLPVIAEIARSLADVRDVGEVMQRVTDGAVMLTRAQGAYAEQVDSSRESVRVVATSGHGAPAIGTRAAFPGSLTSAIIDGAAPLALSRMQGIGESIAPYLNESCRGCTALVTPLLYERVALGALVLLRSADEPDFPPGEIVQARVLSDLASLLLRRVLLVERAEQERRSLVTERALLDAVLDQMPSGVSIAEAPSGRLLFHNEEAVRILRHPMLESADYTGYERYGAHHPDGTPYRPEEYPIARALRGEVVRNEEMLYLRGDGTFTHLSVNAAPVRDESGGITRSVSTFHDIAEAKRATREREAARAAADEANRAKSEFLANMSHELRTPINAIVGYADLLCMQIAGPLTDQQQAQLERIRASSGHLLGLINEILDLAKVESGQMRVGRERGRVEDAMSAAVVLIEPQAAERGIELASRCRRGADTYYFGDDDRVRQILVNLLSNAIKFTEPGGRVTISCGISASPPPGARLSGEGPWAYVEVEDTGIGIAPERLGSVFEPFVQVESERTRTRAGTGLGLTISRQLARLMEGDLTAQSRLGQGSRFTLCLPTSAAPDTPTSAPPPRSAPPPSLRRVGEALLAQAEPVLGTFIERLRTDPLLPGAPAQSRIELEDHVVTFLTEIAQSLLILADGDDPALMRDGSDIQRLISERHGAQRARLGWDEAQLRREFHILRDTVEHGVLHETAADEDPGIGQALAALMHIIQQAEQISVRGLRLSIATQDLTTGAGASEPET
jgi:signal transduction histidine kinase